MAIDPKFKKIYFSKTPGDLYKFVPQTTYADPAAAQSTAPSENPYDLRDELYEVFQAKERLEQERRGKEEHIHHQPPAEKHLPLQRSNHLRGTEEVDMATGPVKPAESGK